MADIEIGKVRINISSGIGPDSAIVFYFNCNTITDDQSPSKGSGTIDFSNAASFTSETGQVGNAVDTNGTSWENVAFQVSGNLDLAIGTIGFYVNIVTNTQYGNLFYVSTSSPYWLVYVNGANTAIGFGYKDSSSVDNEVTVSNGWHFYEASWDGTLNKLSTRLDGGSWTERTGLTGSNPSGTTVGMGTGDGNTLTVYFDQVMIANTYQKDLYSVRNSTSP